MPEDAHAAARPQIALRLLGGFELAVDTQPVPLAPAAQRLVALLALTPDWPARSTIAGTLWPDVNPRRASGNLRSALWRTTRVAGRVVVVAHPNWLRLDDDVHVDLVDMQRQARVCADPAWTPPERVETTDLLVDLLPDWSEDWVAVPRECYRQVRLRALEALCAHQRQHGRLQEALRVGLAAVTADPLRESAHRQLVEVHLAEGNVAEAVRQYHFYREILGERLGLAPSPVIRHLVAPLLACPARR